MFALSSAFIFFFIPKHSTLPLHTFACHYSLFVFSLLPLMLLLLPSMLLLILSFRRGRCHCCFCWIAIMCALAHSYTIYTRWMYDVHIAFTLACMRCEYTNCLQQHFRKFVLRRTKWHIKYKQTHTHNTIHIRMYDELTFDNNHAADSSVPFSHVLHRWLGFGFVKIE